MDLSLSCFIDRHDKIKATPSKNIQHIITSMDSNCMKQLLLIYCKYFYNSSNRQRLKISNNSIHSNILNKIDQLKSKPGARILSQTVNRFQNLPQMLLSYIMSFVDQKSRIKFPIVCYSFLKSSYASITISNCTITRQFIINKLSQNAFNHHKFSNCQIITFDKLDYNRSQKKLTNIKLNLAKMLQLQSIKHIDLDQPYCNSPTLLKYFSLSHINKLTIYSSFIPHININSPNIKSLAI
eukprot:521442_1